MSTRPATHTHAPLSPRPVHGVPVARPWLALALAVATGAGCGSAPVVASAPDLGSVSPAAFVSNCKPGPVPSEATIPASRLAAGGGGKGLSAVLPGGRRITPAGTLLDIGGYPIALRVLPGDRYAIVTDDAVRDQALLLVDLAATDPQKPNAITLPYPVTTGNSHSPGLFYGLALTASGQRIYVSNGGYDPVDDSKPADQHVNTIEVYDIAYPKDGVPTLTKNEALTISLRFTPLQKSFQQRLPSGLTLSSDEKTLYVACQSDGSLAIIDVSPGPGYGEEIGTAVLPGLAPYDVGVDEVSHTAFVSLWGGVRGSSGQPIDGVVPVDVSNPRMPVAAAMPIATGKAAEAELFLSGKLYVANADADTLSVIDAATRTVKTAPVTSSMILGAAPNNLAIEPPSANGSGRVYIANANENSVVVLDLGSLAILGHVPTAWYPTAVAVRSDGSLVIASTRGLGTGPRDGKTVLPYTEGTLQVLPRPSDAELAAGSKVVLGNIERPHSLEAPLDCGAVTNPADQRFPIPAALGANSPIKYAFLIVRENKTYDSVLGDLGIGNGDPSLMVWSDDMVPNVQALAREFVLLDNFYSHAELSLQGHEWTTGCIANDYVEKGWGATEDYGRGYRPDTAFSATSDGRLGFPGTGSIFVHLDQQGIPNHNYGEISNLLGAKHGFDPGFPGLFFNTNILDVVKVAYVIENTFTLGADLEPFTYILLPNDHTNGTMVGASHPASMMADNDEAVGRFVDAISHSPLWPQSIIFVVQDDPGGSGDHVERHRSTCFMASPWLKRHTISSTNFDLGSVYKTIELVVGSKPMNVYDGHAAAMYELFSPTPDLTPWNFVPRKLPMTQNQPGDPLSAESSSMDFSQPDRVDTSRIEWKVTHGAASEPPWLTGAEKRSRWMQIAVDPDGDGDAD